MIVGIDLGTTNSAIGVWRDGRAELIPNSLGSFLTPSAVSIGAFVASAVESGAKILSDGFSAYRSLKDYNHQPKIVG